MSKPKKPAPKAAPAKKPAAKPVPAKKPVAKAPVKTVAKPAAKKPVVKAPVKAPTKVATKAPGKKVAPKPVAKKTAVKAPVKAPVPKPVAKAPVKAPAKVIAKPPVKAQAPAPKVAPEPATKKGKKPALEHDKAVKIISEHRVKHHQVAPAHKAKRKVGPIAYSLDDIEEYLKLRGSLKINLYVPGQEDTRATAKAAKAAAAKAEIKPVQNRQVTAVSVADLLGFNPFAGKAGATREEELIPQKYRKYYKLLIELRDHVNEGLATHTEEALTKTGKDETGDVSAYSQHMADAGSDSFDRDFALSLVNNENEALYEISEAIDRMKDGTYGVCEVNGKPIVHDRLVAVPFTRYSAEGQREMEKNRRRGRRTAGGNPLLDMGDGISFGTGGDEGGESASTAGGGDEA